MDCIKRSLYNFFRLLELVIVGFKLSLRLPYLSQSHHHLELKVTLSIGYADCLLLALLEYSILNATQYQLSLHCVSKDCQYDFLLYQVGSK